MKERRPGISALLGLLVVVIIIGGLFFIEIPIASKNTSSTNGFSTTSTSSGVTTSPTGGSTGRLVLKIVQPLVVAPNQGESVSMTFSSVGTVSGNYTFAASGLPQGVTAAFSPASLSFPGGASSTVTVSLTAATGAAIANATTTISATAGTSVYTGTFGVESVGALVFMQGNQFVPNSLTVAPGTKVYWLNLDAVGGGEAAGGVAVGHDVTAVSPAGLFSSGNGNLVQYAQYGFTFTTAGAVSYKSQAQSSMTGTITVS